MSQSEPPTVPSNLQYHEGMSWNDLEKLAKNLCFAYSELLMQNHETMVQNASIECAFLNERKNREIYQEAWQKQHRALSTIASAVEWRILEMSSTKEKTELINKLFAARSRSQKTVI